MRRAALLCAGAVCLSAVVSASGGVVQVRDRVGGESELGLSGGFFRTGTGGVVRASVHGAPSAVTPTGSYDFEMNEGTGFHESGMFAITPTDTLGFGPNLPDNVGARYLGLPATFYGFEGSDLKSLEALWGNAFSESQTTPVHAAAFQVIIWELALDGAYDLDEGRFALDLSDLESQRVANLADIWFRNIEQQVWTKRVGLTAFISESSRPLIMAVPAPASTALLALGAVVAGRRRRA